MGWSPLLVVTVVILGWTALAVLVGWMWSRWFRWLRGDFDKK